MDLPVGTVARLRWGRGYLVVERVPDGWLPTGLPGAVPVDDPRIGSVQVLFLPGGHETHLQWGLASRTFVDGPFDRVEGPMARARVRELVARHEENVRRGRAPHEQAVARTVGPWVVAEA